MLIHLRMSGDIRVEKTSTNAPQKHDRMVLRFTDGWQMVFNDPRKFGRIWLVDQIEEITSNLGVEPLSDELTGEGLYSKTACHLAGGSNRCCLIKASWRGWGISTRMKPCSWRRFTHLTPAREITALQAESLLRSIRFVLEEGIRRNGASIDWVYRGGDFQNHFNVYQRTGEPCKVCGTKIERIVVGQRGTHYCPHCQPYSMTSAGDQNIK